MRDQQARGIRVRVVSAQRAGDWIVRGIYAFKSVEEVEAEVLNVTGRVGIIDLEWTTHEYLIPHYLAYPAGDLPGLSGWSEWGGVYIHRYTSQDRYGDAERVDLKVGIR